MRKHIYTCDENGFNMEPLAPVNNIYDARASILEQYFPCDGAEIIHERADNVGGTIFTVRMADMPNGDEYPREYYCMTK